MCSYRKKSIFPCFTTSETWHINRIKFEQRKLEFIKTAKALAIDLDLCCPFGVLIIFWIVCINVFLYVYFWISLIIKTFSTCPYLCRYLFWLYFFENKFVLFLSIPLYSLCPLCQKTLNMNSQSNYHLFPQWWLQTYYIMYLFISIYLVCQYLV